MGALDAADATQLLVLIMGDALKWADKINFNIIF